MRRSVGVWLLLLAVVCACGEGGHFRPSHVGTSAIDVRRDGAVIRHGAVGAGKFKGEGTYALVDVFNQLSIALDVALEGELLDSAGEPVGALNRDALRVPAGAQRTFALVHHDGKVSTAASADIRVVHAQLAHHALPMRVADANVYQDGNRVVVAANIVNEFDRELIVVVVAGFYDGSKRIMERPFSVIRIPANMTKPARFVGPDGSASGYLFTGEFFY